MPFMNPRSRVFADRTAGGIALAQKLQRSNLKPPVIVLGLPRGGVPVAFEVARVLNAPLDVMLVRKVGMPGQPELAIGAIASGNIVVHEPRIAISLSNSVVSSSGGSGSIGPVLGRSS
jgi:putative phosphoribosyl transferase